jgi:hypothetical protein
LRRLARTPSSLVRPLADADRRRLGSLKCGRSKAPYAGVVHQYLGSHVGAVAVFFRLGLNPPPDVEIGSLIRTGRVPRRKLRNFHKPGFDCIEKSEVEDDPRKRLANLVAGTLDVEWCRREVDTEIDSAPPAAACKLADPVEALNPNRRLTLHGVGKERACGRKKCPRDDRC